MAEKKSWWQAHRPTTRRLAQLYCALLYNAHLKGFVTGRIFTGHSKAVCVPGLNCYSCPGAVGACPLGALQNSVASSGARAGTYVLGILLLFGVLLGRTVCGWLCPAGMLQELLYRIPTPKLRKSRVTRVLSYLKYVILAVFAVILPLWYALGEQAAVPAFCKYICPAGTLEGAGGLLLSPENSDLFSMLGALFTNKAVILLFTGLACIFCFRAFCRFLCPLGAVYGLFNRFSLIGVRVDAGKCTGCGACVKNCKMDVRRVGDRECIHCGECVARCSACALSLKCGKAALLTPERAKNAAEGKPRKTAGRIAWGIALAVLAFVLVWVNFVSPSPESAPLPAVTEESGLPVGWEPGYKLEDFTTDLIGGGSFDLKECRGHVTFINLWATWCGPCVREMPYFVRLQQEHPDVRVLAVHSSLVTEPVEPYLQQQGWPLAFALDTDDGQLYKIVNGTELLPRTVVLNAKGEVVYNRPGSVTYEMLEALLKQAEESL